MSTTLNRRSFLRAALLTGGGLVLHFNWPSAHAAAATTDTPAAESAVLNSYIKIAENGNITLFNPNPEFGQNVKTSLPMLLAEELDANWEDVAVEQADFFPERFARQFTGGSRSVGSAWIPLRNAGATARYMLVAAAAKQWNVPVEEITTKDSVIHHKNSGKSIAYGAIASAASAIPVPDKVKLKDPKDFHIIGTSKKNVEIDNLLTGKPLFTSDYKVEGMLIAMIVHPPAFGLEVKAVDDTEARKMPGVRDVFTIDVFNADYAPNAFDTLTFNRLVVVTGDTIWQVMQAKKRLKVTWQTAAATEYSVGAFVKDEKAVRPVGLESTADHYAQMAQYAQQAGIVKRRDGNPEEAFKSAARILERTYTAPYLVHNTMEPVSCFAHVMADKAEFYAPIQAPEFITGTLSARLGLPKEKIAIKLARMGGGFGLRAYGHHLVEAAVISKQVGGPIKLVYTREDEATYGIYRPTYSATYRAAFDKDNKLLALHVKAGGIPESPLSENRFPAGAIDNYLAESWQIASNITIGAFRAPRSNFMAAAEQSFLDELAAELGEDPIDYRLALLRRAKDNPVGKSNDYDAARYIEVIELARDQSNWGTKKAGVGRGFSAYFCHNTYAAEVVDMVIENGEPRVKSVVAAVDCGIVVNKDAAINMAEGALIDGIGNALFGEQLFEDGVPQKSNFNNYRIIRMNEIPKHIDVHFVDNGKAPTGMGEPLFPPMFAAIANGIFSLTGKRVYKQPFLKHMEA